MRPVRSTVTSRCVTDVEPIAVGKNIKDSAIVRVAEWSATKGFWLFLLSDILWVVGGLHDRAYALVFLQALSVASQNVRGVYENRQPASLPDP
jgi:hypothetical protein